MEKLDLESIKSEFDNSPISFQPVIELSKTRIIDELVGKRKISLYIHIPFCIKRCSFCNLLAYIKHSNANTEVELYVEYLIREIELYGNKTLANYQIEAVHFGGGTPSFLSIQQIDGIIESLHKYLDCSQLKEVCFESYPVTLTTDKIKYLSSVEGLKLNIGIQTFDEYQLECINRGQTLEHSLNAIEDARKQGISSVGIDLICGLPSSSSETLIKDIKTAIKSEVDHFAIYPLWINKNTQLHHDVHRNGLVLPSYDERKKSINYADDVFDKSGYERYSIFHYTNKPDEKHLYGKYQMEDKEWVGVGVGAISHFQGLVYENSKRMDDYIESIDQSRFPIDSGKKLTSIESMKRSFLYNVRLKNESRNLFHNKYGIPLEEMFKEKLDILTEMNLISKLNNNYCLTTDGILNINWIEGWF